MVVTSSETLLEPKLPSRVPSLEPSKQSKEESLPSREKSSKLRAT